MKRLGAICSDHEKHRSELHALDFIIGGDDFVAHLHGQLHGDARLLHRNHRAVNVFALTAQQLLSRVIGRFLQLVHLADGLLEPLSEASPLSPSLSCDAGAIR